MSLAKLVLSFNVRETEDLIVELCVLSEMVLSNKLILAPDTLIIFVTSPRADFKLVFAKFYAAFCAALAFGLIALSAVKALSRV